jgi:iron complex transport system permease protein
MANRVKRPVLLSALLLLLVLIVTPWFGAEISSPLEVINGGSPERDIFLRFRLTRTLLAMMSGGALALTGCMFQAVLRNSLASDYTLGISSGASLGAVLAICLSIPWIWTGSMLGAATALLGVAGFALRQRRLSAHTLILAGVSVQALCTALVLLVQSTVGLSKSFSIMMWLIGSIDAVPVQPLLMYSSVIVVLGAWIVWKAPEWDLVSMGESWAVARGTDVRRLLWYACIVGAGITAATVSMSGPIGFVGLMAPHFVRQFAGASHRMLLPASFLTGAAFLTLCDAAARTLLRPAEIPVGIVTAILGAPGLIWMLSSHRREE